MRPSFTPCPYKVLLGCIGEGVEAEQAETPWLCAGGGAVIGVATVVDMNNLPSPSSFPFLPLPTLSSVPPPPSSVSSPSLPFPLSPPPPG